MPDDDIDPRLAAQLAVEPLDDVTRRRLVRNALDAADPAPSEPRRARRSAPMLIAAAAIAIVLLGGGALVAVLDSDGSTPAAAPTPAHTPVEERSATAAPAHPEAQNRRDAFANAPSPVDLGAVGNLSDPAVVASLRVAGSTSPAPAAAAATGRVAQLLDRLDGSTCVTIGTPVALATGRLDGRRALVVVALDAAGKPTIDAVLSDPCEVRRL